MRNPESRWRLLPVGIGLIGAFVLTPAVRGDDACSALRLGNNTGAIHAALTSALKGVAPNKTNNGGLGNQMWATIVDQDGKVCAVTFTGSTRISQWPGSRVISAQKANTAAAFNLPAGAGGTVDALSTANLWTQTQPGGSLFGLQFSNPVDPAVAYGNRGTAAGDAAKYGTPQMSWSTAHKAIWFLYIVNEQAKMSELTAYNITKNFNKYFKASKTINSGNVMTALDKEKLKGANSTVGTNVSEGTTKYFLTQAGIALAERLAQGQTVTAD